MRSSTLFSLSRSYLSFVSFLYILRSTPEAFFLSFYLSDVPFASKDRRENSNVFAEDEARAALTVEEAFRLSPRLVSLHSIDQ